MKSGYFFINIVENTELNYSKDWEVWEGVLLSLFLCISNKTNFPWLITSDVIKPNGWAQKDINKT